MKALKKIVGFDMGVEFGKQIDAIMTGRASGDEGAVLQLRQALNAGGIGKDEARSLCENAPRFVQMLIEGLYPAYGRLTFRTFVEYAGRGMLTNAVISRAMS